MEDREILKNFCKAFFIDISIKSNIFIEFDPSFTEELIIFSDITRMIGSSPRIQYVKYTEIDYTALVVNMKYLLDVLNYIREKDFDEFVSIGRIDEKVIDYEYKILSVTGCPEIKEASSFSIFPNADISKFDICYNTLVGDIFSYTESSEIGGCYTVTNSSISLEEFKEYLKLYNRHHKDWDKFHILSVLYAYRYGLLKDQSLVQFIETLKTL